MSKIATYGRSDSRSPPPGGGGDSRLSPPRANMQRSQHGQAPRRYERQAAPNFLTGQDGIQPDIEAIKAATEKVVVATINEAVEMVAVERIIAVPAVDAAMEALVVATIDEAIDVVLSPRPSAWTKARDLKSRISAAAAFMEIQDEKRFIGSGLTARVVLRTSLGAPYGDEPNGMLYERLPLVGKEKLLVLPSRGEIIIADGELQMHISDQVGNPVRSLLLAYGPLNPHTTSLSSADGNLEVEIQPYPGTSEPIFGLGEIRIKLPGNVLQKALNRPPPPGALTPVERETAKRRVSTGRAATADEAARADGRGVSRGEAAAVSLTAMTRMSRLSTVSKREGSDGSGGEAQPQSLMSLSDDVPHAPHAPRTSTALSGSSRRIQFKAVSKTAVGAKSIAAAGDERWLRRAAENAAAKPDAPGDSAPDAADARSAFVFRDGEFGLGYYDDGPAAASDAAAAPAAAAEAGQPWSGVAAPSFPTGVAAPTPAAPVADGVRETHLAYESHDYVTHMEAPLGPRASTTRGGGRRFLKAALPKAAAATTMAKLSARRAAAKGGGAAAALDAAVAAAGAPAAVDDGGDGADGARGAAHSSANRPWSPGGPEGLPPPPSPADPVEDEPLWAPSPSPPSAPSAPSAPKQDAESVGDDERGRNDVANLPRLPIASASRPPTGRVSQSARGRREAAAAAAASELSAPFSARLSRRADLSADSVSQDVKTRARSPRLPTQEPLAPTLAVASMQVRPQYATWVHEGASSMDKASGRGQEGARRTMAKLLCALHERTEQSEWSAPDLALLWGARDLHKGGEGALLAAIETRLGGAAAAAFAAAVAASGISALPFVASASEGASGAWRHMPVVASADRPASSMAPASITERPITCEVPRLPAERTPRAVMTASLLTPRYLSTAHSPREDATRTRTAECSMVSASALEAAAPSAARISLPLRGMSQARSDQLRCTPRKPPEPDVGGFQLPNMPHFQAKGRVLVTAGAKFGVASSLALANQLARRPAELQAFPPPPPPPPMYGYY